MIRAVIVDDEIHSCEALQILLKQTCHLVEVVGVFTSAKEAVTNLKELKPSLLFLDIEMPNMSGFDLLEALPDAEFETIFTTSYNQYAIKAFKFSAVDYLLKPIDRQELKMAIEKVAKKQKDTMVQQLQLLLEKVNQPASNPSRIALPTMQGLEFVPVDSILYCSANSNYTEFFFSGKKKLLVSRTLKEIEELLSDYGFLRIHNSHIVNLNSITRYVRGEGGYVVMTDGASVDVSRSRKEILMQKLQPTKF